MRGLNKFIHSEHPSYMNKLICFVKRVYKQNNRNNPIVLQWSRQNLAVPWPFKNLFFQNIYLRSFCIHCVILFSININQITILKKKTYKTLIKMVKLSIWTEQWKIMMFIQVNKFVKLKLLYTFKYWSCKFFSSLFSYFFSSLFHVWEGIHTHTHIISLSTFIIYIFLAILNLFLVLMILTIRIFGSYCFVIR